MSDLSIIILTRNEQLHLERCLFNVAKLEPKGVFVVDCFSNDDTLQISQRCGAMLFRHKWPGCQAIQFQWALDNLPIKSRWILRLDADEYLTEELIAEIKEKLPRMDAAVDGVVLK